MPNLSPPRLLTFLVSLAAAGLAVTTIYMRVPVVGGTIAAHRTWILVGADALLAIGVVSRSL